MVEGVGSSRPTKTIKRGSDIAPPPDPPLNALATTSDTIVEDVSMDIRTNTNKCWAQSEFPRVDDA